MADLSPDARQVLVLRRVEGFTIEETAATMRLSIATVKRRLSEAEARLDVLRGVGS